VKREVFTEEHQLFREQVRRFLYDAIVIEEIAWARAHGLAIPLHSDICLPYIVSYGSEELKRKYVPGRSPARSFSVPP